MSPGVAAMEGDVHEAPDGVDSDAAWPLHTARTIMNLKKTLVREITENSSRLFSYMIEWCDTPKVVQPGCC